MLKVIRSDQRNSSGEPGTSSANVAVSPHRKRSISKRLNVDETDEESQKRPPKYICELCFRRFNKGSNLRSHVRAHYDERPFACSVCHKAFSRAHDRKRHERLHDKEKFDEHHGGHKEGGSQSCEQTITGRDSPGRDLRVESSQSPGPSSTEEVTAITDQEIDTVDSLLLGEDCNEINLGLPVSINDPYPTMPEITWPIVDALSRHPDKGFMGSITPDSTNHVMDAIPAVLPGSAYSRWWAEYVQANRISTLLSAQDQCASIILPSELQ